MNDKFVVSTNEIGAIIVTDVETDRVYFYDTIYDFFGLIRLLNEQQATIEELKEENEQLRQQHQRLYNYFRDYLEDEMSGNAFSEMWDFVKEDEKWDNE